MWRWKQRYTSQGTPNIAENHQKHKTDFFPQPSKGGNLAQLNQPTESWDLIKKLF